MLLSSLLLLILLATSRGGRPRLPRQAFVGVDCRTALLLPLVELGVRSQGECLPQGLWRRSSDD